jgi:predicted O-methyltransferase YrrM
MNPPTPQAILELARNFMESRILLSAAELDLFTLLASNPLCAEEIAGKIEADLRSLAILLDALAAIGFLSKEGNQYRCPPPVSSLLSKGSPDSILPMIHHMAHVWQRWSNLTERVKGREEPGKPIESQETNQMTAFIGAMHSIAAKLAPGIVAAVNPGAARHLLDVGGASGTYTIAFLQAGPKMKATLFDRPAVVEMARQRLRDSGFLDRVTLLAGDFYRDEFPLGHDLAFLSAIIHQNSPEQNLDLYRKVFLSLAEGGRIIIRDHVMETDRTRPKDGAIFAVNMLVGTAGGKTYTFEEIQAGLAKAGFIRIRLLQQGGHMDGLVEGFKPT